MGYGIDFQKVKERNDTVRLIIAIENHQLLALAIAEHRYIINNIKDIIEMICRISFIMLYGVIGEIRGYCSSDSIRSHFAISFR